MNLLETYWRTQNGVILKQLLLLSSNKLLSVNLRIYSCTKDGNEYKTTSVQSYGINHQSSKFTAQSSCYKQLIWLLSGYYKIKYSQEIIINKRFQIIKLHTFCSNIYCTQNDSEFLYPPSNDVWCYLLKILQTEKAEHLKMCTT